MKKIIFALLLVAILAASVGQLALASTNEEQIAELAKQNEKVTDAKCVIYECACVVAIKTEKFTAKSEYDQFVNELVEKIKADYKVEHVFVTRNPKIMQQVEQLSGMSEQERDGAIKKIIEHEIAHHKHPNRPHMPQKTNA